MNHAETLFDREDAESIPAPATGPLVQAAFTRIGMAFARLETAVETLAVAARAIPAEGNESLHGQIAALKADNARLAEIVNQRETDVAELAKLNSAVSDRLESSIKTLRTLVDK